MASSSYALENFPESIEGIKGGNYWIPYLIGVPVCSSFDECLIINKETAKS